MRTQDEKIKGFNLLELIVVVVIIGVISAVGYPNFSKWRKDREARDAVIKIKTLIQGIYSQTQRGQYAFVQVHISEEANGADRNLIVTSKGMKPQTLANLLNDEDSDWWIARDDPESDTTFIEPDYANICQIEDDPSLLRWDDDPDQGSDNIEVRQIIFENVTTNWTDTTGAICFGKNDRWFSGNGLHLRWSISKGRWRGWHANHVISGKDRCRDRLFRRCIRHREIRHRESRSSAHIPAGDRRGKPGVERQNPADQESIC